MLRVAELARLELTEAEVERLQRDLHRIVDYVGELPEVDADGDGLTYPVLPLRPDRPRPGLAREAFLEQAPERTAEAVVVPKVGDLE